jgi:hypothetical protein
MSMRASFEAKSQFAALAAQKGLTESALLALVIDQLLASNSASVASNDAATDCDEGCANDRVTLRLRPGDRALAHAKAAARRMKTSSHLAMLVRTHVREVPVMPPTELEELMTVAGHLAALGRQMRRVAASAGAQGLEAVDHQLLMDVGNTVESVRESVAALVCTNLMSWEAGHA